jgi:RimJ/RimL family protein N-acetyltransferase
LPTTPTALARGSSAPPERETRQLRLRAPVPTDVDPLFEIQGDPHGMRFTYCAGSREATRQFLEAHAARYAEDGYAPWTLVHKVDARVVGWGGLNRDPQAPAWGTEVSYFVHPAYAGRGLASELVRASLALAFDELGLAEVGAFTRPANRASARVLRKCGFAFVRHVPELERDQYRIARPLRTAPPSGSWP